MAGYQGRREQNNEAHFKEFLFSKSLRASLKIPFEFYEILLTTFYQSKVIQKIRSHQTRKKPKIQIHVILVLLMS